MACTKQANVIKRILKEWEREKKKKKTPWPLKHVSALDTEQQNVLAFLYIHRASGSSNTDFFCNVHFPTNQ